MPNLYYHFSVYIFELIICLDFSSYWFSRFPVVTFNTRSSQFGLFSIDCKEITRINY